MGEPINRSFLLFGYLEADPLPGRLEEIFGWVVGIVSIAKDLGNPADVLLASLCGYGQRISRFRFSWLRTKKYTLQGSYAGEKRGEGPLYFALFKLCEVGKTEIDGTERVMSDIAYYRPCCLI